MNRCFAYLACTALLANMVCCQTVPVEDQSEAPVVAIRGMVTNERGKPVQGVTVQVCGVQYLREGRWSGIIALGDMPRYSTDEQGRFSIPVNECTRLDLWFYKPGFAPTFLYDVSPSSEELKVVIGPGVPVVGSVTRRVEGKLQPVRDVAVQLKSPYVDLWYQQQAFTDKEGKYILRVPPPPTVRKWQVVFLNEIVPLNVEDGDQIRGPDFVLAIEVRRGEEKPP